MSQNMEDDDEVDEDLKRRRERMEEEKKNKAARKINSVGGTPETRSGDTVAARKTTSTHGRRTPHATAGLRAAPTASVLPVELGGWLSA